LGVSRQRFLLGFGAARVLRYSLVAWIGVVYGHAVVRLWSRSLAKWSTPFLCVFVALLAGAVCYAVWQVRRHRKSEAAEGRAIEATRAG